jgi:hypothetical protein
MFPSSWATSFQVTKQDPPGEENKAPSHRGGALSLCKPEAWHLSLSDLQSCKLVFDKTTEDQTRFRLYRPDGFEVRTIQECNGEEKIGAIYSVLALGGRSPSPSPSTGEVQRCSQVEEDEVVTGVSVYVEGGSYNGRGPEYFVVFETMQGSVIVTELLKCGAMAWDANPPNVTFRCSLGKLLYSVKVSEEGATLKVLKDYAEGLQAAETMSQVVAVAQVAEPARRRYALRLFGHASGQQPQTRFGAEEGKSASIADGQGRCAMMFLDEPH